MPMVTIKGFGVEFFMRDPKEKGKPPKPLTEITQEQFKDGRNRRFGSTNLEKFDIPFWNAMINGRHPAYTARKKFVLDGGEDKDTDEEDKDTDEGEKTLGVIGALAVADIKKHKLFNAGRSVTELLAQPKKEFKPLEFEHVEYGMDVVGEGVIYGDENAKFWSNPIWCNSRVGETDTNLPDGTVVQIGGDFFQNSYDPDFIVYNVIIFHPSRPGTSTTTTTASSKDFTVFGYAKDVFPPTDFHTASYLPSLKCILILGNMSAPESDHDLASRGITPVYLLHAHTWSIEKKETTGDGPGIIWKHEARVEDGMLRVSGTHEQWEWNKTERRVFKERGEAKTEEVEFGEAWRLDLESWIWTKEKSEWVTVGKKDGRRRGGF